MIVKWPGTELEQPELGRLSWRWHGTVTLVESYVVNRELVR